MPNRRRSQLNAIALLTLTLACVEESGPPAPSRDVDVARDGLGAQSCDPQDPGVSAHLAHAGTPARDALACAECHSPDAAACAQGVSVGFGPLARAGGATPVWDAATRTCSGVYCHGATTAAPPGPVAWAWVDPSPQPPEVACATCHGYPPASPHTADTACHTCHPATVAADGSIDLAGGRHLDGHLDVAGGSGCSRCHGFPPPTGLHALHATPADAAATASYGDLTLVQDGVAGAAPPDASAYAFGCGHCHPLDVAKHQDGAVEVELYDAGAPAGSLKARAAPGAGYDGSSGTCAGAYCHSSGQASPAFAATPGWLSGVELGCDGCHGNPPAYASGGPGTPTANGHVNLADDGYEFGHFLGMPGVWHTTKHGGPGAAPITCQTCHFDTVDPANTAPGGFYYLDTTGRYLLPGGDPGRIDWGWTAQLDCTSCHTGLAGAPPQGTGRVLPLRHVNGVRDVVFDPRTVLPPVPGLPPAPNVPVAPYWMADASTSVPWPPSAAWTGTTVSFGVGGVTYAPDSKTCSGVACHLAQPSAVWGAPYGWGPSGENCNLCHPM